MTIALATGDPAGVGPEISIRAALELAGRGERVLIFGDARQLRAIARAPLPASIELIDTGPVAPEAIALRAPSREGGAAQLRALDAAIETVASGRARVLVTAPTSKEAIVSSGTPFVGQTEHLARRAGLADDAVTMLFLGPRLCVGLTTTHLAIRDVPGAITRARVERTLVHLGEALVALGRADRPIALAGLNPHAGEHGLFGDEEPRVLEPALAGALAREPFVSGRATAAGVIPAETAFRKAATGAYAGVVAMFHDQATIASKLLDWSSAVNTTWGLPFVRTSVDHGVAYDAVGSADPEGMIAAALLAAELVPPR